MLTGQLTGKPVKVDNLPVYHWSSKSLQFPALFTGASVKSDEEEFLRVLEGRAKDGGKLKVVDVGRNEKEVEVKEMKVLHEHVIIMLSIGTIHERSEFV